MHPALHYRPSHRRSGRQRAPKSTHKIHLLPRFKQLELLFPFVSISAVQGGPTFLSDPRHSSTEQLRWQSGSPTRWSADANCSFTGLVMKCPSLEIYFFWSNLTIQSNQRLLIRVLGQRSFCYWEIGRSSLLLNSDTTSLINTLTDGHLLRQSH